MEKLQPREKNALPKSHGKSPSGSQASFGWHGQPATQAVRDSFSSDGKDHLLRQLINTNSVKPKEVFTSSEEVGEVQRKFS